jgi:aquaporin Z
LGIGFVGVSLAFGLTVLTMAYAIGHISGCHLNPAVSVGLVVGKRFPASDLPAYVAAQVLGGIAGAAVLYFIASGKDGFSLAGGFASNGFGAHSPGGYALGACLAAEVVLTFMFLMIILGSPDRRAPPGLRADRHWTRSYADSPHRHSGDEPVGEPGAQYRSSRVRGRLGD